MLMGRVVYGGRQYTSVHAYRRPVTSHRTGVTKKEPMNAQQRFEFDVRNAVGYPGTVNQIDVAKNIVQIGIYWRDVIRKCQKRHRKLPDIPEEGRLALMKIAEKIPRTRNTKPRRSA
jgi:hypothetical protein